jgi:hypothetical protein
VSTGISKSDLLLRTGIARPHGDVVDRTECEPASDIECSAS